MCVRDRWVAGITAAVAVTVDAKSSATFDTIIAHAWLCGRAGAQAATTHVLAFRGIIRRRQCGFEVSIFLVPNI